MQPKAAASLHHLKKAAVVPPYHMTGTCIRASSFPSAPCPDSWPVTDTWLCVCAGLADSIQRLEQEEHYIVQQLDDVASQLGRAGKLALEERADLKEDWKQLVDRLLSLRELIVACLEVQGAQFPVCRAPHGRRSAFALWLSTVAAVLHTAGRCCNSSSELLTCMGTCLLLEACGSC
jgi:hypothetical protein